MMISFDYVAFLTLVDCFVKPICAWKIFNNEILKVILDLTLILNENGLPIDSSHD